MQRAEGMRASSDGHGVFWRRWTPENGHKATVCLVHGLGEHCGRYDQVAGQLAASGYATSGIDLRGFGNSPGRRGHLRFASALRDIDEMLAEERQRAELPLFLYGHSLGGLLVLLYGLEYRPSLTGMVVTGPALRTALREQQPLKVAMAKTLAALVPWFTIPSGLDATKLNRDPEVLAAYRADPLIHNRASLGFAADSFRAMDRLFAEAGRFELPLLLIHGGADTINLVSGSEAFAARYGADCTLKVYPGVFHAVEHEPERVQIVDDVVRWLDARIPVDAIS